MLACDGNCNKAWGVAARPNISFDPAEPDDVAYLADHELGDAPTQSDTWEGGRNKPYTPLEMNKWCSRQCERSVVVDAGETPILPDFTRRLYNQPDKHTGENTSNLSRAQPVAAPTASANSAS